MTKLILFTFLCLCHFSTLAAAQAPGATDLTSDEPTLKAQFLNAAKQIQSQLPGAQIETRLIPSSVSGLGIDSLYIPAKGLARNLIVLTAGIHGVEAPAGSLEERIVMDTCLDSSPNQAGETVDRSKTAVLILHSVNPYGFHESRRNNEDNVDLNRNCFDYRKRPFPGSLLTNKDYDKVRPVFEDRMSALSLLGHLIERSSIRSAIAGGQYSYPQDIYYGGDHVENECAAIQQVIDAHMAGATNILNIDFHTGLNTADINHIMINPPPEDSQSKEAFKKEVDTLKTSLFPEDECKGLCKVEDPGDDDFLTHGDITQWIYDTYPEKRKNGLVIAITSELGTALPTTVLPAMVNENFCHSHPEKCNADQKAAAKKDLVNAFNPPYPKWRNQVFNSGVQMCRAVARFSKLD